MPLAALLASVVFASPAPRPVIVELFSSEGCSSCPDADAALAALDREQPVPGAQVLALELHVDYWNQLGWKDPFSNAAYAERQGAYAEAMGKNGVYTPQAVIDGADELVGSRASALRSAIAKAASRPSAHVALVRSADALDVRVDALPAGADANSEVWLAVTERGLATDVPRGENAGRHLAHAPVVRALTQLGALENGAFHANVKATLPTGVKAANARFVVFVQERKSRHILGAAQL
ncbi:MAG: DUF1223 domain-containing protein [Deltaproteobacteria bacterium]|nr:DUF1223 domain-containing protein [Deltaproteobacteria bacterium]